MLTVMAVREVRRTPLISVSLLILLTLAVMLAGAGAGLLARLGGAADGLLARAHAPQVAQMHTGPVDEGRLDAWAARTPEVQAHQDMLLLGIDGQHLLFDGRSQAHNVQENSLVVPATERDLLLQLDGTPLTRVRPGEIWLPVHYRIEQHLDVGQTVTITAPDGFHLELRIAGFVRDALMNTAIASSKRLAVSPEDQALVRQHTGVEEHLIALWLEDPTATASMVTAYQSADLPTNGPIVTTGAFRLFTVFGEGLVAGVVLMAAVLLVLVGLLCLRLTLLTALQQDIREISVLRAVGVSMRDVRRVHTVRYGVIAATATAVGLIGATLLVPVLAQGLTAYTGSDTSPLSILAPVPAALAVLVVVMAGVRITLRRLGRITPVEGLRRGASTGEPRLSAVSLHRSRRAPVPVLLGLMTLLRVPGQHLLLLLVLGVSTVLVALPTNAAITLASSSFPRSVGIPAGDLLVQVQHSGPHSEREFREALQRLEADPAVVDTFAFTTTRWLTPDAEGIMIRLDVDSGEHERHPLDYVEGRAPRTSSEIAVSLLALSEIGAGVGEALPLTGADGRTEQLRIVGSYQDVTNGGTTAKALLPTEGQQVMRHSIAAHLQEGEDPQTVVQRVGDGRDLARVADTRSYADQQFGPIARQLRQAAVLAGGLALALAAAMAALSARLMLASEATEVAVQRSLGISDGAIRGQFLTRILLVGAIGVPLGALVAGTAGETAFNILFELLYSGQLLTGTSRIALQGLPWITWGVLPIALLLATAAATWMACRPLRRMTVSSLNAE